MRITFVLEMNALRVGKANPEAFSRSNKRLLYLLEALVKCNRNYLQSHRVPSIYASGVHYEREQGGDEEWLDIPSILKRGMGDCEDLACWRVVELREQGIHAKALLKWYHSPSRRVTLYHVLVRWPDGTIEDPSKKLGMKGRV